MEIEVGKTYRVKGACSPVEADNYINRKDRRKVLHLTMSLFPVSLYDFTVTPDNASDVELLKTLTTTDKVQVDVASCCSYDDSGIKSKFAIWPKRFSPVGFILNYGETIDAQWLKSNGFIMVGKKDVYLESPVTLEEVE
jgi:hypothetical protein